MTKFLGKFFWFFLLGWVADVYIWLVFRVLALVIFFRFFGEWLGVGEVGFVFEGGLLLVAVQGLWGWLSLYGCFSCGWSCVFLVGVWDMGYPVFRRCLNGIGWHVRIAFEAQKGWRLKIGGGIE